ncbi:MAG: hypothetical protein NZO58_03470, partial [Gemmataceae bacterium]|nr:hypothetical protein [Gemmataceae bacterium]
MANLISRARALYNLNHLAASAADTAALDALIAAVSAAVERHCRRTFTMTTHDEVHDGRAQPELVLGHFPLLSVER